MQHQPPPRPRLRPAGGQQANAVGQRRPTAPLRGPPTNGAGEKVVATIRRRPREAATCTKPGRNDRQLDRNQNAQR
eukprot:11195667-Lingulodinium_polyedra.AAC.1